MPDEKPSRVLVSRPARSSTDERGRNVWTDPIETARLELVSTQELRRILDEDDAGNRKSIEDVAEGDAEGVLARNPDNGNFEIIDDVDLQAILDNESGLPKLNRPQDVTLVPLTDQSESAADELSLVSTQALRKVLGKPDPEADKDSLDEPGGGFNPYDKN